MGRLGVDMVDFFSKKFIKDYENYSDPKVRGQYGFLSSIVSIILNVVMATFKIILGLVTNSVAIMADGLNNLSDVASNVATLLGFIFSMKNPDKEHPFGHGRLEYLSGLSISVLILFVGFQTLWEAIHHIVSPVSVVFSPLAIVVLVFSIIVKYFMGRFNLTIGERIKSTTLIAAGRDSRVDILATLVTLIALLSSLWTELTIDGILGAIVSLIILKTGYDIGKETITSLLGAPPDATLLEAVVKFTSTYDGILGTHDLMIHDYGHGRRYLTMHVEVSKNEELMAIHEIIDQLERDICDVFNLKATIHLDPVDLEDELTKEMKNIVGVIVNQLDENYSIHDFRIRRYAGELTLIFDVMIPADDVQPHHQIMKLIDTEIKKHNPQFQTLIEIDHSYT